MGEADLAWIPYAASSVITGVLGAWVWTRHRRAEAARELALWLGLLTLWSLGLIGELRAPTLSGKIAWDNAQYAVAPAIGGAMVAFAWRYTGTPRRQAWRLGAVVTAVAAVPVAVVLVGTFAWGLRDSARLAHEGPTPVLLYDFVVWDYCASLVLYAAVIAATVHLVRARRAQHPAHRATTTLILLAFLVPMLLVGLAFFDVTVFGQRDFGPLAFAITGVILTWALFRRRLFDLVPVARAAVLEALPDAVFVVDSAGRVVDRNPAAERLAGGLAGVGASARELPALWAAVRQRQRPARTFEVPLEDRHYEVISVPIQRASQPQRGTAIVFRDVTALRRANLELADRVLERTEELGWTTAELKESEERLRAIFDGTRTLLALLDTDGLVLATNRAARELVGVSSTAVLGRPYGETPWWTHSEAARGALNTALQRARAGEIAHFSTTHRAASGELRDVDGTLTPATTRPGGTRWIIAEARDVTELRQAQREREEMDARLQQTGRLEALGRLAGGVAHDFNNLLTVIGGNVDLLRTDEHAPDRSAMLADVALAAESASTLARQLLAFSRQRPTEGDPVELDARLLEATSMVRRLLPESVRLVVSPGAPGSRVAIDPGQLDQIVVNLVVNAEQAMPAGGTIEIRSSVVVLDAPPPGSVGASSLTGRCAVLAVKDDGHGMSPVVREHVLEPFFTTKPGGTGLGLATVYGLVRQGNGCLVVDSAPGVGTQFSLYFPLIGGAAAAVSGARPVLDLDGKRVLVVDDEPLVLHVATRMLEGAGCRVTAFSDPVAALAEARRTAGEYSALVTDVRMPALSGVQLARALRDAAPVVFISAHTTEEEVLAWLLEGRGAFVRKPFTADELLIAVRGTIAAAARPGASLSPCS